MKTQSYLIIFIVSTILLAGCHKGFFSRKSYILHRDAKSIECSEIQLVFNNEESLNWHNDSLGINGDRRRLLLKNFDLFKQGELNGVSYECFNALLGPANESSVPYEDSLKSYHISSDHDSVIMLYISYNKIFDKVVRSEIFIQENEISGKKSICNPKITHELDSVLLERLAVKLPHGRQLEKAAEFLKTTKWNKEESKFQPLLNDLMGESITCLARYLGPLDYYQMVYYNGIRGEGQSCQAFLRKYDLTIQYSCDDLIVTAITRRISGMKMMFAP